MALSNSIPSGIKNVYRYEVTIAAGAGSGTQAITAVDMGKTELRFLGYRSLSGGAGTATVELTNSTTLTARRNDAPAGSTVVTVELTERW